MWLQAGLQAFQLLRLWSTDSHKHWPRLFKAVVRELMVGCLAQHTHEGAASVQWVLLYSLALYVSLIVCNVSLLANQAKQLAGAPQPAADGDPALLETLQHLQRLPLSVLLIICQLMAEPIGFWRETSPPQRLPGCSWTDELTCSCLGEDF